MGHEPVQNPPHARTVIPSAKRSKLCHNPQIHPIEAYITEVEQASSKLPTQEADELRADVNQLLKQQHHQSRKQYNINPS